MTRRSPSSAETAEPVSPHEVKVAAALMAADVAAFLHEPVRTRQRMALRRTAGECAAVVLAAAAVRELVRRELADRRAQGQPLTDELMLARRALSALVEQSFRGAP